MQTDKEFYKMATNNSTGNIKQDKKTCFIDDNRGTIALGASYEIESLSLLMINILNNNYSSDNVKIDPLALRGIAMRIKQLNSVIMSAAGDDLEDNHSLNGRFSGFQFQYINKLLND